MSSFAATNVVITGQNFVSIPQVEAIGSNGSITPANTVTFTSATSITANDLTFIFQPKKSGDRNFPRGESG